MKPFLLSATFVLFLMSWVPAVGGVCPCNGDANLDGSITWDDFRCFEELLFGGSSECPNTDINCDGVSDACDMAVLQCQLDGGGPECCDVPCGACCLGERDDASGRGQLGNCLETTEAFCTGELFWGTYQGDGVSCRPSPCDCNGNGTPDGEEIAEGAPDCDDDGVLDECEFPDPNTVGACCIPDLGCTETSEALCEGQGGEFAGTCTGCDEQSFALIIEADGSVFVHVVGPPVDCGPPVGSPSGVPCTGPKIDPWTSPAANALMCHNFAAGNPIPADFFGPGSDPFAGVVCFEGVPLGDPTFPNADTLIERASDPFDRCSLPSATPQTVAIEIVALNLVSQAPMTVTFNGGQNPEPWDVAVDLSEVSPPTGWLAATKSHCNGGTYTSALNVQPRFTFTKVGGGGTMVLDTGLAGETAIALVQTNPLPWVHDVDPLLFAVIDPCSDFHPGISESNPTTACDCQPNGIRDKCDIESDPSSDGNGNGIPDACEGPGCFALSQVKIEDRGRVRVRGAFNPGQPFDPLTDVASFTIMDATGQILISAGPFQPKGDPAKREFEFKTPPGQQPEIKAKFKLGKCEFDLAVKDVDVSAVSGLEITVSLQAGASFGQESVTAERKRKKLEFKRKPKPKCCP